MLSAGYPTKSPTAQRGCKGIKINAIINVLACFPLLWYAPRPQKKQKNPLFERALIIISD
jgi:hypothetical protein